MLTIDQTAPSQATIHEFNLAAFDHKAIIIDQLTSGAQQLGRCIASTRLVRYLGRKLVRES